MAGPARAWDDPNAMLGVDEALARVLAAFAPLPAVELPLLDALGMVAAVDIVADQNVPPFRNSAMDGYALRSGDTRAAADGSPATLRVVGALAAGSAPTQSVRPGEALRIMTGAPLPAGADAVARFEETTADPDGTVAVERPIAPVENVREAGEDVRAGEVVIAAGAVLRPADIGLLAALNRATAAVHRRPRVAILSTGDELTPVGADRPLRPGQIRDSNSYTLAALVKRSGGEPILLGIARDSSDDLNRKLSEAGQVDLIITSGGVSVGDYDMVKDVLRARGRIDIWQVRMKPGKPLAFGRLGATPLLGLPGNPVAALVSFEQFGRAAIRRMLGFNAVALPEVEATLGEPFTNTGRRRHFVRGRLTRDGAGYVARPTGRQGAGMLSPMARGNCLIVILETESAMPAGARVRVQLLDQELP